MNLYKKYHKPAALIFYLIIAVILTFPLVNNILTHIPGTEGDSFLFVWNHWWVKYSLSNFINPYSTDMIVYPFNTNLVFHTFTFINALISAILQIVLPLILVFNLIFILSLVLASFGTYLLLHYLFNNRFTALIGGLLFSFNSYIWSEAYGHFQYVSIYFIPFVILYFIKIIKEEKRSNFLIFGLLLAMSLYNEFYYTVGLLIFISLLIFWFALKDKELLLSKLKHIGYGFLTWAIISAPLLYLSIKTALSEIFPVANLYQINLYTPDIRSFIIPPAFQTIYGDKFINHYQSLGFHGSVIYLSFTLIFLFLIGYFLGKKESFLSSKFWLFTAIVFFFMTLGPFLYLEGYIFDLGGVKFTISLPYIFFYLLPFVKGILVPPRFIIFVILCLIVIGGFFLNKIFEKLKGKPILKWVVTALIMGIFIFENFSVPIPVVNAEIPEFYYKIKDEKDDYVILELPFALSTSFYTLGTVSTSAKMEYYQTVHHKKILGGFISRVPDSYYEFYSKITGLDYLINPNKKIEVEILNKIKNNVLINFQKLNIKYIIVHPEYYNHEQLINTITFLNNIYGIEPELIDSMFIYKIK